MNFRIYQDNEGQWRWSLLANNNLVIGDSSEGYRTRRNIIRAIDKILDEWIKLEGNIPITERHR